MIVKTLLWIAAALMFCSCYEAAPLEDEFSSPDDTDTDAYGDTEIETDAGNDTDTDWTFDCGRACDAEAVCGAYSSTYSGWDSCFDGCEASLATVMTPEQEDAVECVWFECVFTSEAGELPCTEWVACIHSCTQWLFE